MKRPSDYIHADEADAQRPEADRAAASGTAASTEPGNGREPIAQPRLGPVGYARFFWRQLTSMRTALLLLLLLAIAAVPGSLFPQRGSDLNGVLQYEQQNPEAFAVLDWFQLFDVYSSVWFSAIYLLLFVSLIGCVIPRTKHHFVALLSRPPRTPMQLRRLPAFARRVVPDASGGPGTAGQSAVEAAVESGRRLLRRQGYRVERYGDSISAERGYARETGNLLFHSALVGILICVAVGGGFGYYGQRVIVEGNSFTNLLTSYDSFNEGSLFDESMLEPFSIALEDFEAEYTLNPQTFGPQPLDFTATVTTTEQSGEQRQTELKVNHPIDIAGTQVYLLGNGFAPVITVRDSTGEIAFSQAVPFLPQDANLTSLGVVKVPDAQPDDLGFIGFFYPSAIGTDSGALTSIWPEPDVPLLTLNLYTGDLGLDEGVPKNAYSLDVDELVKRTGTDTGVDSITLEPGQTAELPDGLGSVTFEDLRRFVSIDVHHDPAQGWVLLFTGLAVAGLVTSLFVPRRRVWIKVRNDEAGGLEIEYAGLARGEDPGLQRAVDDIAERHSQELAQTGADSA